VNTPNLRWRRRLVTRGVLWLHIVFLALAMGLWYDFAHQGAPAFKSMHTLVRWIPLNPEVTWASLCTVAAGLGIYGWWRQSSNIYSLALIFSTWVFVTRMAGSLHDGQFLHASLAGAFSLCVLAELMLVPANRRYTHASDLDQSAGAHSDEVA
jgi:hypothetical protein